MTARFPLTLYSPSMSRPAAQTHTAPSQQHTHNSDTHTQQQPAALPLRSTAFTHFSTKRGIVVRSCAHSSPRWQPKTLSAGGGGEDEKQAADSQWKCCVRQKAWPVCRRRLRPRMYPFSLTDCSVGRFIRNFISLVRTFLGSLSPTELDE